MQLSRMSRIVSYQGGRNLLRSSSRVFSDGSPKRTTLTNARISISKPYSEIPYSLLEITRFGALSIPKAPETAEYIMNMPPTYKVPETTTYLPNILQLGLIPGVRQFVVFEPTVSMALKEAARRGVSLENAIIDDPEEDIKTSEQAVRVASRYSQILETEDVKSMAVKPSALCPTVILESGDIKHPQFQFMLKTIEDLSLRAKELGKIIYVDAETPLCE
jgi:hypothetical protein